MTSVELYVQQVLSNGVVRLNAIQILSSDVRDDVIPRTLRIHFEDQIVDTSTSDNFIHDYLANGERQGKHCNFKRLGNRIIWALD